jgi:small-conductance mechanosensitive channel
MTRTLQSLSARNDLPEYLSALLIFFVAIAAAQILFRVCKSGRLARLGRFSRLAEGVLLQSLVPGLRFGAFFFALERLTMPRALHQSVHLFGAIVLTCALIRLTTALIHFWMIEDWPRRHADGKSVESQFKTFMPIVHIAVWLVGFMLLADNVGFRVSTLVAGLGIGGVALALASQALLGDLFSYFAILLDRPFDIGDFVVIEGCIGTVESIGIKTTRLRSLTGEQLVLSNTDLTKSRLRNFQRMQMRRVEFKFTLPCDTPVDQLEELPGLVSRLIQERPKTRFERSHISAITPNGVELETVYFIETGDYNLYMDVQHALWLGIKAECERRAISLGSRPQKVTLEAPRAPSIVTTGDPVFAPRTDVAA